jgi:nitroreductase
MLELIRKRRSIRKFTNTPVSDADIKTLLEAAMAAPSANDLRPWEFVVVRRQDVRQRLADMKEWSYMCADAPVVFVVCGHEQSSGHWVEDASAATENLLLAAVALGLGGVWVAVYPDQPREQYAREALGIPAELRVLCMVPVGHPAESKPADTKYDAAKVHYDGYSR